MGGEQPAWRALVEVMGSPGRASPGCGPGELPGQPRVRKATAQSLPASRRGRRCGFRGPASRRGLVWERRV